METERDRPKETRGKGGERFRDIDREKKCTQKKTQRGIDTDNKKREKEGKRSNREAKETRD